MKQFLLIFSVVAFWSVLGAEYDVKQLTLREGATIENGVLVLDGKNAYAEIPGTENITIAAPGITFACSIKPRFDARKGNGNEMMDSYFSKKGASFIFCRWGELISSRVLNSKTKKYDIERCYSLPKAGQWTHLAFVLEPISGEENVWIQRFYVNGKQKFEKKVENFSPVAGHGLVELGKGWGGSWMFTGEMADIIIEQKALTVEEIATLVAKSRGMNSK